jgi:hypothetical protein
MTKPRSQWTHTGSRTMGYPRYGDRYWKVTVADKTEDERGMVRAAVGLYSNAPNAVFGLMRKMRIELEDPSLLQIWCELLPPKPQRMSKAAYMRKLRATHESF